MKKIAISLGIIGIVAAIVIGATTAYFSDTETSTGNTLTAGVIDIVVNDENPWTGTYTGELSDMKPCETKKIAFTIKNLEASNPVKVWKKIDIVSQTDGTVTEPECTEGGGTWTWAVDPGEGTCNGSYVSRDNLAAYTLYDLWVNETPIIKESQYVRLDNIDGVWIYLGELAKGAEMRVVQSYHLSSWPDAPEAEVTNWAQGDKMTFDITLMATQMNAPGPEGAQATATLDMVGKNPTTWEEVGGASGTLTYNTSGPTFKYDFVGTGLGDIEYCLIYYADPWPGTGGFEIECKAATSGELAMNGSKDIGSIPVASDDNSPAGAKIWLVPSADYDTTNDKMISWSPSTYLFEENLIQYTDTD